MRCAPPPRRANLTERDPIFASHEQRSPGRSCGPASRSNNPVAAFPFPRACSRPAFLRPENWQRLVARNSRREFIFQPLSEPQVYHDGRDGWNLFPANDKHFLETVLYLMQIALDCLLEYPIYCIRALNSSCKKLSAGAVTVTSLVEKCFSIAPPIRSSNPKRGVSCWFYVT